MSQQNHFAVGGPEYPFEISVVIVSFNTRALLAECLHSLLGECAHLPPPLRAEILVVDNASSDGSAEMVRQEFGAASSPVRLIESGENLGFGRANNLGFAAAQGRYLVLLNSDAFLHEDALALAIAHMDASPQVGVGGGLQVGRTGALNPSARSFPALWMELVVLLGLSDRYPKSRLFGAPDRTWADPLQAAEVDWMPGAFLVLRREALAAAGVFDPDFFFYSEEVDLCRRIKAKGFRVFYWPDVVITHLCGESGRKAGQGFSERGAQVVLWRMRSGLLYYRKHHGMKVWLARWLEEFFYSLRWIRNRLSFDAERRRQAPEYARLAALMRQAWRETRGGRISPPQPW